jgi:hypothetical protein
MGSLMIKDRIEGEGEERQIIRKRKPGGWNSSVGLGRKETGGADFGKDTERDMRIWERRGSDARARSVRDGISADGKEGIG